MAFISDTFLSFLLACIVIELTPGPNMFYLAAISSIHGKKAGFSMVAGIALGLWGLGLISVFGVTAIFLEKPALYHTLRWAGVFYMVWLAWENWQTMKESCERIARFDVRYFQRGLITNLLNPKALIFYITVFPTFIGSSRPVLPELLIMLTVYVGIATLVHSAIALLADCSHDFFENPARVKTIRRVFSFLLLLVAIWFAWSTRITQ